ncbi:pentatricopeptide repeat-containing protein At1g26460, mitochondrial-like [Apium graveolens]|uniref:pentatricopeptide repeat-containing protein At1g26460, mitochondrial-like n=1 Tax=Apium graveolens TaxID=4045 RepID=UPI003D79E27A
MSIAALNCIILGCANIRDVYRAKKTFNAISTEFGRLTPTIDSYNGLICAFGNLNQREDSAMFFNQLKGLGIKANSTTYVLLIDAHLSAGDHKSALSVIEDMVLSGFSPTKRIRVRCAREMDTENYADVNALVLMR